MRAPTPGVVIGCVTDNQDPDNEGRIAVAFPWLGDTVSRWLPLATPMGGAGRGLHMLPEPEDEALVAFQHGDFNHGYILGFLWNAKHSPPTTSPDDRGLFSRAGHQIRFLDMDGTGGNWGALLIVDAHGNMVTMANGVMTVSAVGHLNIEAASMSIMGRQVNPMGGAI
jgi:uncharacterized protein involved in type VI secretion and phage assembly